MERMRYAEDDGPWPVPPTGCTLLGPSGNGVPKGFSTNTTHLCGIYYPPSTPFINISSCCAGPVEVGGDCFHFCTPIGGDMQSFSSCARHQVNQPFMTHCNRAKAEVDLSQPHVIATWEGWWSAWSQPPSRVGLLAIAAVCVFGIYKSVAYRRRAGKVEYASSKKRHMDGIV